MDKTKKIKSSTAAAGVEGSLALSSPPPPPRQKKSSHKKDTRKTGKKYQLSLSLA